MEIRAREGGSGVAAEEASRARRGTSSRVARDVARDARLAARSTATGNERITSRIRPSRVGGDEDDEARRRRFSTTRWAIRSFARARGRRRSAIPRVPGADEVEAWEGGGAMITHHTRRTVNSIRARSSDAITEFFLLRLW